MAGPLTRTERVELRLTPDELAQGKEGAGLAGLDLSAFIRWGMVVLAEKLRKKSRAGALIAGKGAKLDREQRRNTAALKALNDELEAGLSK